MIEHLERLKAAVANRYRIEHELGRGGMAVVYLAEDVKHGRQVAIKVLQPELAATLGHERFLREIETAARLSHPHILPLYDSGDADGYLYYVMPYVEGDSLRDRLRREGPLPVDDALRIAREVAGALDYAHEQGVVHRDVKPGNIMLRRGHAVIADFGIARAVSEAGGEKVTRTGLSVGSPVYMSPEQARGSERLDGRTDIYALGCVLYEMLAGEPPFTGATPASITARKELESAPRLKTLRDTVPPAVELAVERALAKMPADRFGTAAEFAEALERGAKVPADRAGAAEPLSSAVADEAEPSTGPELARIPPRLRRRRLGITAALAAAAVATAALAWFGLGRDRGPAAFQSVAVLPFLDRSPGGDQAYLAEGMAEDLLNALARIPEFKVTARSSSFRFDEPNPDILEVGRTLGVEAIVEGGLHHQGDEIRVTVQLVNAADGFQVWSGSYMRGAENIFDTQEEMARDIIAALGAQRPGADAPLLADAQETQPEVKDLLLRGKYLLNRGQDQQALRQAVEVFRQAVALDSTYAEAYRGLARAYSGLTFFTAGAEADSLRTLVRRVNDRSLALDSTSSAAHVVLAVRLRRDRRFDESLREFRRALELDPGDAEVRTEYAHTLLLAGRQGESVEEARRAVELSPLSLESRGILLAALGFADRDEEMLQEATRVLELDPENNTGLYWKAAALLGLERYEESVETSSRLVSLEPENHYALTLLGYGYALSGDREAALNLLDGAEEVGVHLKEFAAIHGMLGDLDAAFAYLDRALVEERSTLLGMDADPSFASLHDDPRWEAFLAKINPPE